MCSEPLQGWRHVKVTARHTTQDFTHGLQDLADIHFPQATVIRVVSDNLHTHTPAALYATFPPAEACRLLHKLDFHDTPRPGSWLNMAEIEFAVVSTQCLGRRLGDRRRSVTQSLPGRPNAMPRRPLLIGALLQPRLDASSDTSTPYDPCGALLEGLGFLAALPL